MISIRKKRLRNKGFTLIELVVVMVTLGIISVLAVPKFIDLNSSAVIASNESLVGGIKSAASFTYMTSVIQGQQHLASGIIVIDGESINVVYGYPAGTADGIAKMMNINATIWGSNGPSGDWHSRASTYSGAWIFWHGNFTENAGVLACYVRYREPVSPNQAPLIDLEQGAC